MGLAELLHNQIREPETSWAIGTFGAVAEFHRNIDEPVALSASRAVTARGGIDLCVDAAVERLTSGDSWMYGIALCLAGDASAMMSYWRSGLFRPADERSARALEQWRANN